MTQAPTQRLRLADALWLALWLCVLVAECLFLTHGRQFWSDEIFGSLVARDPSFTHMLFAWRSGADGGGLFFYVAARLWSDIFGPSATALRLFTATGMAVGLAFTWLAARRWYRLGIVAFTVPFCWLTAHAILRQLMVGRFYGMLLAAAAAAVYAYVRTAETPRPLPQLLLFVFATHCLLVGTHPFGLIYSAVIIVATIALDLISRRSFRPSVYLAALAGWSILWPSRLALRASAAVGKPHFWTTTPDLDDLQSAFAFWTDELQWLWLVMLVAVLALAIYKRLRRSKSPAIIPSTRPDGPAWLIGFALMAVIPALWLVSQHGNSYFVDRYLLPTLIGAALLQCAALDRLLPSPLTRRRWQSAAIVTAMVLIALGTIWGLLADVPTLYAEPPLTYTGRLAALLPEGQPIVVERADVFTEAVFAQPAHDWLYLFDWQTVLLPESPRGEVSGYHEMENLQRVGYYASAIQPSDDFLAHHSDFYVVHDPAELWFLRRIQSNPAFTAEQLSQFPHGDRIETIWHVHRNPLKPTPDKPAPHAIP